MLEMYYLWACPSVPDTLQSLTQKVNARRNINLSGAETEIFQDTCCQTAYISSILVGNKYVDHSDVVGALPVGTAPTTSSFST